MVAMGDDVVKEKEMMMNQQPKLKRITIKFNGRVITALISPTTWSAYMSQINNTDPNDSTISSSSTMAHVSKRKIQEIHPELDPVKKKQRQMVVPNSNSRVQSSSSISVTTDYISNQSSQLPKMKMNTHPSQSTITTTHINTHFQVSNKNTTEIYTTSTCQDYESKLQLSKRKLQQGYEASERAKKQRQIVVLTTDNEKPIPKSRSSQASRFKSKKLQRLYVNHKTRQF